MSERPRNLQELYNRVRQGHRDEVILEEMIRLGFWPREGTLPNDPADEIRRRSEILRELRALQTETFRLHNEKQLRKAILKQRLADARKRREETKARNEEKRKARAAAWKQRKQTELLFVGEAVSGGLSQKVGRPERLSAQGLPVLQTPAELANAMGLTVPALRFLAYSRIVSEKSHYIRFHLPKKTGGTRLISAPMPRLKGAQRWVLDSILSKVPPHSAAHGFAPARSILSNATPHVGADVVVNLDLKDFFPSVQWRRVRGLFVALGYSEAVATLLALLCSEPDIETITLDGRRWHVATGPRRLPQGAPTSPMITNLLCRRLDRRLAGLAQKMGVTYTRYADDMTFSGPADAPVGRLLKKVQEIVVAEGFTVHPEKIRVLRKGRRQEVTGLVVNQKPAVPREAVRRFRATLYQVEKDGPAGHRMGEGADVIASLAGFAAYMEMIDPARAAPYAPRIQALIEAHRPARVVPPVVPPAVSSVVPPVVSPATPPTVSPVVEPPAAPPVEPPAEPAKKKPWWKLF